jgi:catalase-peroxidase
LLTLTAPEMTVLVGGLRVLGANTAARRTASSPPARRADNDFFVNLLDMGTVWKATGAGPNSSRPRPQPPAR